MFKVSEWSENLDGNLPQSFRIFQSFGRAAAITIYVYGRGKLPYQIFRLENDV